jgi:hypothetical protein
MEGDVLKCPDWIYSRGETNPPGDNRFESIGRKSASVLKVPPKRSSKRG